MVILLPKPPGMFGVSSIRLNQELFFIFFVPDFGRVEPGQGARAFWPGEVPGLRGMLAVRVTRPNLNRLRLTALRAAARRSQGGIPLVYPSSLNQSKRSLAGH